MIAFEFLCADLMLTECLNKAGQSAAMLPYLNKIRTRLVAITEIDQVKLEHITSHERRIEMTFENYLRLYLIRKGRAIDAINTWGAKLKQKNKYLLPRSYSVTGERLLYPIPFRESQVNLQVSRDPGY
jgi:hypothetical protein